MGKSEDNALKLGLKILRDCLIPRQSGYGHTPIMVSQSPMVTSHRGMAEARAVPGTAVGKPDSIWQCHQQLQPTDSFFFVTNPDRP